RAVDVGLLVEQEQRPPDARAAGQVTRTSVLGPAPLRALAGLDRRDDRLAPVEPEAHAEDGRGRAAGGERLAGPAAEGPVRIAHGLDLLVPSREVGRIHAD